jgi:CRP-like cAMP-binding protein
MMRKDRNKKPSFLGNPIFFSDLTAEMPEGVARDLKRAEKDIFLASGHSLFKRGDPALKVYVLKSGRARLVIDIGGGSKISRSVLVGEVFGLPEAVVRERFETSVEAASDCVFTSIGSADFRRFLHLDPGVCFKLLSVLGRNLHKGRQVLVFLSI